MVAWRAHHRVMALGIVTCLMVGAIALAVSGLVRPGTPFFWFAVAMGLAALAELLGGLTPSP